MTPVACSDLAIDSVEGQRGRPSGVMRFDLLKVVGSSPAFLARPEADRPARAASRSTAFQISEWVSIERGATASSARMQTSNLVRLVGIKTGFVHILNGSGRLKGWTSADTVRAPSETHSLPATIYKICDTALWREAERAGAFAGAPVDHADGYIHFSTAEQVRETAARHFAGQGRSCAGGGRRGRARRRAALRALARRRAVSASLRPAADVARCAG